MYFIPLGCYCLVAAVGEITCPGLLNSVIPVALSIPRTCACARRSRSLLGLCGSWVLLPPVLWEAAL